MRNHRLRLAVLAVVPLAVVPLAGVPTALAAPPMTKAPPTPKSPSSQNITSKLELQVTSTAFAANEAIPHEYSCEGKSISPPLAWSRVPSNARSIAIMVDDPDAPSGTFTHWLVTGISPTTTSLPEGGKLPDGAMAATNSKGTTGYTGPCPPSGEHHYYFHVYALDKAIGKPANKSAFLAAIEGHVVAEGQLVGTYKKSTPP